MHPDELMPKIEEYQSYMDFTEIVPISALEGLNVDHFIDVLKTYLPKDLNIIQMIKFQTILNNL